MFEESIIFVVEYITTLSESDGRMTDELWIGKDLEGDC
jgi:hypothetical protein